jgi:hypothetical protein
MLCAKRCTGFFRTVCNWHSHLKILLSRCSSCASSRRAWSILVELLRPMPPPCRPRSHHLWPQAVRQSLHKTAARSMRIGRQRSLPASAWWQRRTDQTLIHSQAQQQNKGLQHRFILRSIWARRVSQMCGTATAACALLCLISVQGMTASNMPRLGQGLPQRPHFQMRILRAKSGPRRASSVHAVAAASQQANGRWHRWDSTAHQQQHFRGTYNCQHHRTVMLRRSSKRHSPVPVPFAVQHPCWQPMLHWHRSAPQ